MRTARETVMTIHPNPRLPARTDDELALDRPSRQPWREIARAAETVRLDEPRSFGGVPTSRPATGLDLVSRGIGLLLKLTVLLILVAMLWGMVTLIGIGVR